MSHIRGRDIAEYVQSHIDDFHKSRLLKLRELKLEEVLKRKNPYLFKAKNISTSETLVRSIVDAYLSSQEEGLFGAFLEGLAIFICGKVYGGWKSSTEGIDLELDRERVRYIVVIKSGPHWGNSSQIKAMKRDFQKAKRILQTNTPSGIQVIAVNGCCYGTDRRPDKGEYVKLCGERFWSFISGEDNLYVDIIEPLGHRAKERNDDFMREYSKVLNVFTRDFTLAYCTEDGAIAWDRIVKLVSRSDQRTQ